MDTDTLVRRLLDGEAAPPLPDDLAGPVVEQLKKEVDRFWYIDPNRSLKIADLIISIGEQRHDFRQIALGTMARGDTLKLLGQVREAWDTLDKAGQHYLKVDDEVGWARTRIGKLAICTHVKQVDKALVDAEEARLIFKRYGENDRLLRLYNNLGLLHNDLGNYHQAMLVYNDALHVAEALGESAQPVLAPIYVNMGYAYSHLGDFRQAQSYYERCKALASQLGEALLAAHAEMNIAYIAQNQSFYRRALRLLHNAQDTIRGEMLVIYARARRDMVSCYLQLNRFEEARELARQVVDELSALDATADVARVLLLLATAEAELGNYALAHEALNEAEKTYREIGAESWVMTIHLRRGRIALLEGDIVLAASEAHKAGSYFDESNQPVAHAEAALLHGQALFAQGDLDAPVQAGQAALAIARQLKVSSLRYSAHLLVGKVLESQGQLRQSLRRYRAADATVERVQRGLTITLRSGFLEDKHEAVRAQIRLHLKTGNIRCAFETLERAKSQVLFGYLANREHLQWAQDDEPTNALYTELQRLREEHQWFYNQLHSLDLDRNDGDLDVNNLLNEISNRERRMRTLTERLYLNNEAQARAAAVPSFDEIQRSLPDGTLLVEYYNDGNALWAFTLDNSTFQIHNLPLPAASIHELVDKLQFNIECALKVGPDHPVAENLCRVAQRIAHELYVGLMAPLAARLRNRDRVMVVPYGVLHYLPFHLLHTGERYLIEDHEMVVLPTGGLVTRQSPRGRGGTLVLAHSWDGRLPETETEAGVVRDLFAGELYVNEQARRNVLATTPGQILHIAAHGEYRMDQPDLSYIHLADGQVYADDLLQCDLRYELVILSACSTGRAYITGGDELIGLGRGFLYQGAGALIASLWRVDDESTTMLMERTYRALRQGAAKPDALRQAQCAMIAARPRLHPAFWGAFQFIGDPQPLSSPQFDQQEEGS